MGQFAVSNEAVAAVEAAPSFSLSTVPARVAVPKGDLDMVARFKVNITRTGGYNKPVYLLVAGTSMGEFKLGGISIMVPDGAGGFEDFGLANESVTQVDLEMDLSGSDIIEVPFVVQGFEDKPVLAA